jgi:hypothetical protein
MHPKYVLSMVVFSLFCLFYSAVSYAHCCPGACCPMADVTYANLSQNGRIGLNSLVAVEKIGVHRADELAMG